MNVTDNVVLPAETPVIVGAEGTVALLEAAAPAAAAMALTWLRTAGAMVLVPPMIRMSPMLAECSCSHALAGAESRFGTVNNNGRLPPANGPVVNASAKSSPDATNTSPGAPFTSTNRSATCAAVSNRSRPPMRSTPHPEPAPTNSASIWVATCGANAVVPPTSTAHVACNPSTVSSVAGAAPAGGDSSSK